MDTPKIGDVITIVDRNILKEMQTMKITTPKDKESDLSKLEEAIKKIEDQFSKEENGEDYYHLVIEGEYNKQVCQEISKMYRNAGWKSAICMTSSDNGEKGGLTGLQLWRKKHSK